jgi:LuxR family transcriptional regulator, maltose regulon positive regulatory protein
VLDTYAAIMGGPRDAAPTVVRLDELLLDAKLSVPRPRSGAVSRADLIDAARGTDCRVVGVTAPAGYGKSTLLAQWAMLEDRRVAWVSLDRFDDDPAILLTLLASAFARITSGNADLVAEMTGVGASLLGRAAPRLATALRTSPTPFVLMLDDLHAVQAPACHDVLAVVTSGIPRGSQFVSASRYDQLHLAQLRASDDVLELHADDLTFGVAGAEQIFAQAQVHVTTDEAALVVDRTEGWPVGLHLAAMIAKHGRGERAATISGEDRFVADYLYRESLLPLPESSRRFLRYSAVPEQVCASLCDALVGGSGSEEVLRGLEATNVFLVPLDRRRRWYRYHALFREFLLGELRRVEPDVVEKLHLRAADWYEAHGSPALALEHLLNTPERGRCIQLVTTLVMPTYQAGQLSTIRRWLSSLGDVAIAEHPPLAVLSAWNAALTGQAVEAQRWATIVDSSTFDLVPVDGSASFESARAMLHAIMCTAGPERMMTDANVAADLEPPWSVWRDRALCLLGEAHLLAGDADRADALFTEAVAAGTNADVVIDCEAERALLAMDSGRWDDASHHLDVAMATIDDHRMFDYAMSVLAFAGAARLAVHGGRVNEARRQLMRAMRGRPLLTMAVPFLAVRVRLQLAKVYWAIADQATARHLLREIDDIVMHRPALGTLVEEVSTFRAAVNAGTQRRVAGGPPLTPAELRLLPYLQTCLTIREIGDRLFVSRNTVNTQVSSIYRKFGVSSRSDAVEHAMAIGLLGG